MYLPLDEDEAVFADFLCFPLPASRASRYAGVTSSVGYIPEKQDVSKSWKRGRTRSRTREYKKKKREERRRMSEKNNKKNNNNSNNNK